MTDAAAASAAPKTISLTATRGAFYLLEGTLQQQVSDKSAILNVKKSRLWDLLRKANAALIEVDGQKIRDDRFQNWLNKTYPDAGSQVTPGKDSIKRLALAAEYSDNFETWADQEITIVISQKQVDLARDVMKERLSKIGADKDPSQPIARNQHSLSLLIALSLDDSE